MINQATSKVTVIMPVYNGERFLTEAVQSVLDQTWQDWELIIIDDGSTDSTPDILDRLVDRRIVTIRQENAGEAGARNVGLAHATGEYVAFLDADDLYVATALGDLSEFLDSHPEFSVVYADGYFCDANGRTLGRLSDIRSDVPTGDVLDRLVVEPIGIIPSVTMTRRRAMVSYDIKFDERLVIGPDWDFWIRLARHARFGYLDQVVCLYRVHETNITRTSGLHRRLEDQVYIRSKILNAEWFPELPIAARQRIFYGLLIGLLTGQPARQTEIFESRQFQDLTAAVKAELWRHVAVDYLVRRSEEGFAVDCLRKALSIWSVDWRSRLLLGASRLGGCTPSLLLRSWRVIHRAGNLLRSLGRRGPKAVPAALRPVGE